MDDADSGDTGATRALLFDLGGVVLEINFDRVFHAWGARASCDPQALRRRFEFDDAYEQHERGELDASGYFASLRRSLGLRLSDADFIAGWNNLYVGPVPGMVAVLAAATERLPLYAFTNSNPTHQAVWATRYACELSVLGRSSDPERRGAWPTGGANPRSLVHKEKPHILRRGAFSTGGGAFRWPSGSTLVRIDGPPSFRAVHSPLLAGGPATSDSTGSPNRSQHSRR